MSVNEDSTNVLEEYSSAEELIIESSEKDRNNKMYNVVKSPSGSEGKKIFYRWIDVVDNFKLPVKVSFGKDEQWITPTTEWKKIKPGKGYDGKTLLVNKNFYVFSKNVLEPTPAATK